jgi:hypothetical protein
MYRKELPKMTDLTKITQEIKAQELVIETAREKLKALRNELRAGLIELGVADLLADSESTKPQGRTHFARRAELEPATEAEVLSALRKAPASNSAALKAQLGRNPSAALKELKAQHKVVSDGTRGAGARYSLA